MGSRIIEITTDGKHLAAQRGFMVVQKKGEEITRVPLDDIGAVIGCAHGLTYSNHLLIELAKRNALLVLCAPNFTPMAFLWSMDGNYRQSGRMDAQIESTLPKRKQLWRLIVQGKIAQQAAVLENLGLNPIPVRALIKAVKSGDTSNVEAQAARRYWPILFGANFRRDRQAAGANSMLNYGYTILRSAVARALMGAGLHPSIGLHHSNKGNPMRLVDDVMEPFRPFVDYAVWSLIQKGQKEITPEVKQQLAALLDAEVAVKNGATALRTAIQDMATSLALIYEGQKKVSEIALPFPQSPLWQDRR